MNVFARAWQGMTVRKAPPADTLRLGPGGPPAGLVAGPGPRRDPETHPLIGASIDTLDQIVRQALDGRTRGVQDLFDDMYDRDDRVAAVANTRILAVQSLPWSVRPPKGLEEDKRAQAIAKACTTILGRCRTGDGQGWSSCVGNIADAVMRGYSVNEIEWGVSAEGWHVPKALHWRHPRRFGFDAQGRIVRMDYGDGHAGAVLCESFHPDRFVIHQPTAGHAAYPQRRGIFYRMIFPSLFKRAGWKWWVKGAEKWGQPIAIATLPAGQEDKKDEALAMLRRLRSDFVGVAWGGVAVETIAGSGNLNPAIYSSLVDSANTAIAVVGLGQNLTTEVQGGSFAATTAHNLVRIDIRTADTMEIDGVASGQLLERVVRYNWPGEPVPEYVTENTQRGEVTVEDVREGIFNANDYRRAKGHPAMEKGGDEYRVPMVAVPAQIGAGDGGDATESTATATLNSAQVTALLLIVQSVVEGKLPRDAGVNQIVLAFGFSKEQAEDAMGTAGAGFVPALSPSEQADLAAAGGADAGSPLPQKSATTSPPTTSQTSARSTSRLAAELYRRLVE